MVSERRLPAEPLVAAVRHRHGSLHALDQSTRRRLYYMVHTGLSADQADRWSHRLLDGAHPCEVWGQAWWDMSAGGDVIDDHRGRA